MQGRRAAIAQAPPRATFTAPDTQPSPPHAPTALRKPPKPCTQAPQSPGPTSPPLAHRSIPCGAADMYRTPHTHAESVPLERRCIQRHDSGNANGQPVIHVSRTTIPASSSDLRIPKRQHPTARSLGVDIYMWCISVSWVRAARTISELPLRIVFTYFHTKQRAPWPLVFLFGDI